MACFQSLIVFGLVMAAPHVLDKRDIPLTAISLLTTNLVNNPSASGSVKVDLGWEKAVFNFNCQGANGVATCRMQKCGYSMFGLPVSCTTLNCPGSAPTRFDPTINRDKVVAYYQATASSFGCRMSADTALACVYSDVSYGGKAQCYTSGGYFDAPWNDEISSLKVKPGCVVRVDTDGGMRGRLRDITSDTPWVGNDWNDVISAFSITCK